MLDDVCELKNFLGNLQIVIPMGGGKWTGGPTVCVRGRCHDDADARQQMREHYKKEYPGYKEEVDDEQRCLGGVFVFDCTPFELIEKAANEESADLVRKMYEEATELAPLVE